MSIINWLDAVCAVQVWVQTLNHIDPEGEWKTHPMLLHWREQPYSFDFETVSALETYLENAHKIAMERYETNRLAGYKKDKNRIQLELPLRDL